MMPRRSRACSTLAFLSAFLLTHSPVQCIGFTNPTAKNIMDKREQKLVDDKNRPPKFERPSAIVARTKTRDDEDENEVVEDKTVQIGSRDYYEGFTSRDIRDEQVERISGSAVLEPTMKLVGGFSVLIVALLLIFLMSNGLI